MNKRLAIGIIFGGAVAAVTTLVAVTVKWDRRNETAAPTPEAPTVETPPSRIRVLYPPEGAVFPPEMPPPSFKWKNPDAKVSAWSISIALDGASREVAETKTTTWSPDDLLWKRIKEKSTEQPANIFIRGVGEPPSRQVVAEGKVSFSTSSDPVDAPIFYREVPLPFIDAVKDPSKIRWRFGAIDGPDMPPVVLDNLPVCGNCHSFSRDGKTLGMDVDYANDKGSYAIAETAKHMILDKKDIITWSDYEKADNQPTFGLLSQVSPDGRYAISTVKDRSVFVPKDNLAFSQLFFPLKGILAVYDRESGELKALPGADDPRYVHSNPTWSPDGSEIIFARAGAYDLKFLKDETTALLSQEECEEFLEGGKQFKFDLYRIPFNNGNGGKAVPVRGASNNGRSNFFAKYSPDGKWIVYCQADSFMLLQPDSELFIIPAAGGDPRRLAANTRRMNSWHSWSPNGKWIVFSSKATTPYTQLYLTHIDEKGESAPAVALPHMTAPDRAANIPEFVNLPKDAIARIKEAFVDDVSYIRTAMENVRADDLPAATRFLHKALDENPDNTEAMVILGGILADTGNHWEAMTILKKAGKIDPNDSVLYYNLGNAYVGIERFEHAVASFRKTVELDPDNLKAANNWGAVLIAMGRMKEAEEVLVKLTQKAPEYAEAHRNLGDVYLRTNRHAEAIQSFSKAINIDGGNIEAWRQLGVIQLNNKDIHGAIATFTELLKRSPQDISAMINLSIAYNQADDNRSAIGIIQTALHAAKQQRNQGLENACLKYLQIYQTGQKVGE